MSIKAAVSALALTSAMLAGSAFAQDATATTEMMIGGTVVAEQDMEAVKARCEDLKNAQDTQSLTQEPAADDQATGDSTDASSANAGIINEPAEDSETATTLDLTLVTLEECEAGGWLETAM
jgi:TATA-binding protein-associated factor Taf7